MLAGERGLPPVTGVPIGGVHVDVVSGASFRHDRVPGRWLPMAIGAVAIGLNGTGRVLGRDFTSGVGTFLQVIGASATSSLVIGVEVGQPASRLVRVVSHKPANDADGDGRIYSSRSTG